MADPVTAAEARLHLRLPSNIDADETLELERMITAATEYAEDYTNRFWSTKPSAIYYFDSFPVNGTPLIIPGETTANTVSQLTYTQTDGSSVVYDVAKYRTVPGTGSRTRVAPLLGELWPPNKNGLASISITVTHAAPATIPAAVKQAVLILVGSLYEYREDGVVESGISMVNAPITAHRLLHPHKMRVR